MHDEPMEPHKAPLTYRIFWVGLALWALFLLAQAEGWL